MEEARVMMPVVVDAGAVAMKHFTRAKATLKADRTVVTEADLEVQSLLVRALVQHFPEDGIVAEEEGLRRASRSGRHWTVDPIDGTVAFVAGITCWAVALGLVDQGRPVAGFIFCPASDDFYHVVPGEPPQRNGRSMRLKPPGPLEPQSMLLTHTRPHQRYTLDIAFPPRIFCLGTASMHLAHVAIGSADAVLIGHDHIWDLAPGLALLQAGGGALRYLDGTDVEMGVLLDGTPAPQPMLGGWPDTIAQVRRYLDYWGIDSPAREFYG